MSAEEAYRAKQEFLAASEARLRRQLTTTEKKLLTIIFERVIDRMDVSGSRVQNNVTNNELLNSLGRIHKEFTRPANIKVAAQFARNVMELPIRGGEYFGRISEGQAAQISSITDMTRELLRSKLGLTDSMGLKPGGFLQSVVEDTAVQNGLRAVIARSIDNGGHFGSLRTNIRNYLVGTEDSQGAMTRQAEGMLFDTLMEADRASDLAFADQLGLQGGVYVGGLIETTRRFCCELDTKAWTREEMQAMNEAARNGKKWSGYKGDVEIYCGGWNCRHGWRWVGNSALLRMRPDLEVIKGTKKLRPKVGVPPQPRNTGCAKVKKGRA